MFLHLLRPDQGDALPGRYDEGNVLQQLAPCAGLVEADVVEFELFAQAGRNSASIIWPTLPGRSRKSNTILADSQAAPQQPPALQPV